MDLATRFKVNSDELAKPTGVIVLESLCVSKRLKQGIRVQNLLFNAIVLS